MSILWRFCKVHTSFCLGKGWVFIYLVFDSFKCWLMFLNKYIMYLACFQLCYSCDRFISSLNSQTNFIWFIVAMCWELGAGKWGRTSEREIELGQRGWDIKHPVSLLSLTKFLYCVKRMVYNVLNKRRKK